MTRRLGKHLGVVHDPRTLQLRDYLPRRLPTPPARADNARGLLFPMLANDRLGDCTCAAAGHAEITWTRKDGAVNEGQAVALYNRVNGGQDNGAYMLDVLNAWHQAGVGPWKIRAFVKLDQAKLAVQARLAIWQLDGIYVGLALPEAVQSASRWSIPKGKLGPEWAPGSWGGHCIWAPSFSQKQLRIVSWGERIEMTWDFLQRFSDEVYAVVSVDQAAQQHIDVAKLDQDLAQL